MHPLTQSNVHTWQIAGIMFALTCFPTSGLAAGHITFDTQLAFTHDDNVTRAMRESDIRDDAIAAVTLSANFRHSLASHARLALGASVQGEEYVTNDGLSNVGAGLSLKLQYRTSGRLLAPTFTLFGRAWRTDYDSRLRDGERYEAGLTVQKGITDRVSLTGAVAGYTRNSNSAVFDTREGSLMLNFDYRWGARLTQYLGYDYRRGDIVATSAWWLPTAYSAEQAVIDDAFGPGANLYAYRLNAQTQIATLGVSIAVSERQSIDVSARHARAETDGGMTYDRNMASAAYLFRF